MIKPGLINKLIKFSSSNLGYQTVRNENTRMENFLGQRGLIKPGLINKFIKFSDPNLGYQTVRNENTRMENFFGQAGLIKPRTDGKVSQASEKHAGENENQKAFSPGRFHREHAGENENQKAFLLVLGYSSPKCSQMQSKSVFSGTFSSRTRQRKRKSKSVSIRPFSLKPSFFSLVLFGSPS